MEESHLCFQTFRWPLLFMTMSNSSPKIATLPTRIHKIDHKDVPFAIIDKQILNNRELSWKAKGLLAYLLSLPPKWTIRVSELATRSTDKETSVYSALQELREHRYARLVALKGENGHLAGSAWEISEVGFPSEADETSEIEVSQDSGSANLGKQVTSNNTLCTKEKSTNKETSTPIPPKGGESDSSPARISSMPEKEIMPAKENPEQLAERIYEMYPRKVGKPNAIKAILKELKRPPQNSDAAPPNILEATKIMASFWGNVLDKTYCPHPSTWFHQRRFLDAPETWRPKQNATEHRIIKASRECPESLALKMI